MLWRGQRRRRSTRRGLPPPAGGGPGRSPPPPAPRGWSVRYALARATASPIDTAGPPASGGRRPGQDPDHADRRGAQGPAVIVELVRHPREGVLETALLLAILGDPQLTADDGRKPVE